MYQQVARYYDLLHAGLTEDIGFLLTLAGRVGGPVLELGCGTGRVLLPLARAGFAVTGVDNSPAMLALAEEKLRLAPAGVRERVQLLSGDMTNLALPQTAFQLAIVAYNTLLHLDPAGKLAALRAIRRHLAPAGQVVLDLANPLALAQTPNDRMLTLEQVLTDRETGDTVTVLASNWVDTEAQVVQITWLYDATPPAGGVLRRTVAQAAYHYLYPHQLELILHDAHFSLVAMYGNYDQTPYTEESDRLLVVAAPNRA